MNKEYQAPKIEYIEFVAVEDTAATDMSTGQGGGIPGGELVP